MAFVQAIFFRGGREYHFSRDFLISLSRCPAFFSSPMILYQSRKLINETMI
jgi:hypothetical protein